MSSPLNQSADRMGDRFVRARLLTEQQVSEVSLLQREKGLRFGEAAVQLGYLSEADVQAVLSSQFQYSIATASQNDIATPVAIAHTPFSSEAEAIRQIRAELSIRLSGQTPIAIAIVSPNDGEGKSHLAISLAIAFAQSGLHTMLVNADLRKTDRQQLWNEPREVGVSTILSGRSAPSIGESVPNFPFLHILGAGPQPPNPIEILHDGSLTRLMESFSPGFDVYIVDTPSALRSSDAQIIAQQVGTCLMVGQKDQTRLADLHATISLMRTANVHIVGTIYNEIGGSAQNDAKPRRGAWFGRGKRG